MGPLFFYSSLKKKTHEGHLKQMMEGLSSEQQNIFFYFGPTEYFILFLKQYTMLWVLKRTDSTHDYTHG